MNRKYISTLLCLTALFGLCTLVQARTIDELMQEGRNLLNNGAYQQAAVRLKKVVSRMPGNFEARFNLGLAYLSMGNSSDALHQFEQAAGIRPRNAEVWSNLGVAYKQVGYTQKAINAFSRAIRLNPEKMTARINMAAVYEEQGRISQAIRQLKDILQIDPGNITVLMDLAELMQQQDRPKYAKQYLEQALNYDAQNAVAYYKLGNIYWEHYEELEKAAAQYRRAIDIRPDEAEFYYRLGMVLENMEKTDEALDVYTNAISYVDDALKRERIQNRIDIINKGESAAENKAVFEPAGLPDEIATLTREDTVKKKEADTMDVSDLPTGMSDDMEMSAEDSASMSDFDLNTIMEDSKQK